MQEEKIICRAMESIEIDGKLHDGRCWLAANSLGLGMDFSLTLEPVV